MKKSLIIFMLVALLLSLFTSCANIGGAANESPAASAPASSGSTPESTVAPSAEPSLEPQVVALPIVSDRVEFSIWCGYAPPSGMTDENENLAYKEAEKRTNVHINFTNAVIGQEKEQFMLSLASQNLPDSYQTITALWSSGFDSYIENDTILDLTPFIEYAPNYNYIRHQGNTYPTTITDNGYTPGFFMVAKTMQWAVLGPLVRQDYLDAVGKENPATYDELHDVLTAFKENGIKTPFSASVSGLDDWLMVGYNTIYSSGHGGTQFLVDDNGKVSFSVTNEGALRYLTMMNQWYNERLIDTDFFSKDPSFFYAMGRMSNDEIGLMRTLYAGGDIMKFSAVNKDFRLVGMNIPTVNKGDKIGISFGAAPTTLNKDTISVITTACTNVEVFMRWHDYFWTEEGSLLGNYGIEGDSYEFNSDGKPVYTSKIYADPDGKSMFDLMGFVSFAPYQGFWYDWEREFTPNTSQDTLDTKEYWSKNVEAKYNLPQVSLTAEESSEASAILGDIYTYVDEMIVKFITGDEPLANWETFVNQVDSMDVARAVDIYQNAYDRYLNRVK